MTYFLKSGNTYTVSSKDAIDLKESLPVGTYIIKEDPRENLYLESIDSFPPIHKYYGDTLKNCERIITTFINRESSTGVMLTGEKGSGKSLLAKTLSIKLAELSIPTIVVNQPWVGDKFNQLIQLIEQPCMVLFDEFEKVYGSGEQEEVLTLLDGVYPSKKLFVITCNDLWRIDSNMRNRPGRIFYSIKYTGLDKTFIDEYCNDNLHNKTYSGRVSTVASAFSAFNFDMLKALIEEMNRYNESPDESLRLLNIKPDYSNDSKYFITLSVPNKKVVDINYYCDGNTRNHTVWTGNPFSEDIDIHYRCKKGDDFIDAVFSPSDIVSIDSSTNSITFKNAAGATLTLVKIIEINGHFTDAF